MKKSNIWFLLLLLSTLIAAGTHSYLAFKHLDLKLGLSSGPSVCNVSEKFNCDAVSSSQYSEVFGVSIAFFGLFMQLAILIFSTSSRFELSSQTPYLNRLVFWLTLIAAAVSLIMGSISVFKLGTYCLFCMLTYLTSFISFVAALKLSQLDGPAENLGADLKALFAGAKWTLIILILVPATAFLSNAIIMDSYGFGKLDLLTKGAIADWQSAPVQTFNLQESLVEGGSAQPKMVIVEFADFLCPHCKLAYPALENFAKAHKDVKLVFKSFPLDGKCNKALKQEGDGVRCALAGAVICAESLSQKGWQAHHWIFDNQENIHALASSKIMEDLSQAVGLKLEDLNACLTKDSTIEAILKNAAEGATAKVEGTPAVYVNGKRLDRGQFPPFLKGVYDSL